MRIAMIIKKLNICGGNQRHALGIARELSRRGHEITFYTLDYKKGEGFADDIERFPVVSLASATQALPKTKNPFAALKRFFEHIHG